MNELIEDLGMIRQNPKEKNPRRYYKIKCYSCENTLVIRSDRFKKVCYCKTCQKENVTNQAKEKANLQKDESVLKTCSCCKLTKHVYDFHKKYGQYSSSRSICKACRHFNEREANQIYAKTEKGKLISSNNQSNRRVNMYKTSDSSISVEFLQ